MSTNRKLMIIVCGTDHWLQIPVGTFGLSSHLTSLNLEHIILNTSLHTKVGLQGFLDRAIQEGWCFALVLHWKEQTPTFFDVANYLMDRVDSDRVLCGGITASFFAREIIETPRLPNIVIKGDPEDPIRRYCEGYPIDSIENMTWINNGQVEEKPITWLLDSEGFSRLSFTDFSKLIYSERFIEFISKAYCHVNITRGCHANCEFCGGSRSAYRLHSGRSRILVRPTQRVVEDIEQLVRYSTPLTPITNIHLDDTWNNYFPVLKQLSQMTLAKSIFITISERSGLRIDQVRENLDVFKAFHGLRFEISPESDDPDQRKALLSGTGKHIYGNDYVVELISLLNENKIYCHLFYTVYNFRDTPSQIFARISTYRRMMQSFDPAWTTVICVGLALDSASVDYMALPDPPKLVDYYRPTNKFAQILGNLTYIRQPEDVELILTIHFLIQLVDLKFGPNKNPAYSDFDAEPDEVMSIVHELKLEKLMRHEFVMMGRQVELIRQKILERRKNKAHA